MHMNVDSVHLQLAHLPLQPILNNTRERCYSYVKFWADLRKTGRFFEDDPVLFAVYWSALIFLEPLNANCRCLHQIEMIKG